MPRVTVETVDRSISVPPGTVLLDAMRQADVEVHSPCGGKGTCGKCLLRVVAGDVDSRSLGQLSVALVAEGYVLACNTRVLESDVRVEIPVAAGLIGGKISEEDETYLVHEELLPKHWHFDPLVVKWLVQVDPPVLEGGRSDLERLTRAVRKERGQDVVCTLEVMRNCASALRIDDGRVTVTVARDESTLRLVGIEPGDTTARNFALAVDVGTTTVSVELIHLAQASILGIRSDYNDQIVCGLDVISRINYAQKPGRLEDLRMRVLATINRLIGQVCRAHGVAPVEVSNIAVSGNTTMTHLLLGLTPEHIRLHPYTPTVMEVPCLSAKDVGIDVNPGSSICFSPSVGSYVGGDITAGVLCTDLAADSEAISLFMDIGTNGELVVGNRDFLMACACSAGPAFEGGGISCGMRAATGAIESVKIDPESGTATYRTIGDSAPRGVCGTGMIDLLAELFMTGLIDPTGKLARERRSSAIVCEGRRARYVIVPRDMNPAGEEIAITETDIGSILRTKAAIYSACSLMLDKLGLNFSDLARIYVAGGFGRHLDLEQSVRLGLLPDVPREVFRFIGNASLMGSYMVVVSQAYRDLQRALARRMTCLELSADPAYMDQYTGALFLPHTDASRFPSVETRFASSRDGANKQ